MGTRIPGFEPWARAPKVPGLWAPGPKVPGPWAQGPRVQRPWAPGPRVPGPGTLGSGTNGPGTLGSGTKFPRTLGSRTAVVPAFGPAIRFFSGEAPPPHVFKVRVLCGLLEVWQHSALKSGVLVESWVMSLFLVLFLARSRLFSSWAI